MKVISLFRRSDPFITDDELSDALTLAINEPDYLDRQRAEIASLIEAARTERDMKQHHADGQRNIAAGALAEAARLDQEAGERDAFITILIETEQRICALAGGVREAAE